MNKRWAFVVTLATGLTGAGWAANGVARLASPTGGAATGAFQLEDTPKGLHVVGQIQGVPEGEHGFHIHEYGDCGDAGNNAGGHYNPDGHKHGQVLKDGFGNAHPGDMGNVTVKADGTGSVDVVLPRLTLSDGKYPIAGRALILHEKKDDFGQPTGNAGARIGCAPILLIKKP